MKCLLIPVLCSLATSKVMIQGRFAKDMTKGIVDAVMFNCLIFLASVFFSGSYLFGGIDAQTLIGGCIFGIGSICFQVFYVSAFSAGSVSMTVMIVNMGMIIPIIVSKVIYDEPLGISRIIGIILTVVNFYLTTEKTSNSKISLKWILFTLAAMIANAMNSTTQKIYTNSFPSEKASAFVPISYLAAVMVSVIILLVFKIRGQQRTYKINFKVIAPAFTIGVILAVFQIINIYATSVIDGTLLLPAYNGGLTLFTTLASGIVFKTERLTTRQNISIVLGIIAIVLMSI